MNSSSNLWRGPLVATTWGSCLVIIDNSPRDIVQDQLIFIHSPTRILPRVPTRTSDIIITDWICRMFNSIRCCPYIYHSKSITTPEIWLSTFFFRIFFLFSSFYESMLQEPDQLVLPIAYICMLDTYFFVFFIFSYRRKIISHFHSEREEGEA